MLKRSIQILAMAALASAVRAQIPVSSTTLSASITASQTFVCLASATNVAVPSLTANTAGSLLAVDDEFMQVQSSGISSTCFNVLRGVLATSQSNGASAHGNGQKVWVVPPVTVTAGDPSRPITSADYLKQKPFHPLVFAMTPAPQATSASTTDVAGTTKITAIQLDFTAFFTGACVLNGTTAGGTDSWVLYLWDRTGTLLANTALAGTATSGTSQWQCIAFTSPIALGGPNQYFLGVQGNGTTDKYQTYATNAVPTDWPTLSKTGSFGVAPTISTVPTSSGSAPAGAVMALYQ